MTVRGSSKRMAVDVAADQAPAQGDLLLGVGGQPRGLAQEPGSGRGCRPSPDDAGVDVAAFCAPVLQRKGQVPKTVMVS